MKTISLIIVFALTFLCPIAAAAQSLSGHEWREFSVNTKNSYMLGFISGYMKGRWHGITGDGEGMSAGLRWVDEQLCKDKGESVCARLREVRSGRAEMNGVKLTVIGFEKTNGYYVQELDAVYEAFPLCRGKPVSSVLSELVTLWATPKLQQTS